MSLIQIIAIAITFFTGFSGLVYEIAWHKYLANMIGSESKATAIILSIFLFGLAVGYAFFGKYSRKKSPETLLKITGWIEIGIAAWAFIFPQLFSAMWTVSFTSLGIFGDIILCALLIGIPTFLMGGTLPFLTQGLSRNLEESSNVHAKVYAMNTAGAFTGCLFAGFVLIPNLGLPLTILTAGAINLISGLALLILSKFVSSSQIVDSPTMRGPAEEGIQIKTAFILAFINGYLSISFQNLFVRLFAFATGASEYSFTVVVSVFILSLSIGAHQISKKHITLRVLLFNQVVMFVGLGLILFSVPYWAYGVHIWRTMITNVPPNFALYFMVIFMFFLILVWPALSNMGKTMPAVFSLVRTKTETLGDDVGRIYFLNTIGCLFGGLIGGYYLFHYLSIEQIFRLNLVLAAIMIGVPAIRTLNRTQLFAVATSALLLLFLIPKWPEETATIGTFRWRTPVYGTFEGLKKFNEGLVMTSKIVERRDSPNGSAAVLERTLNKNFQDQYGMKVSHSLLVNGKPDGDTGGDRHNMIFAGHLGGIFAGESLKNAAVIGYGTGLTVGALTRYPGIETIDTIEISEAVRDLAHYFDSANYGASIHKKVVWHKTDAYRFFLETDKKYSTIISEPSNPWLSGIERLFAQEFYEIVINKLADDGVYVQWVQTYEMSPESVSMVIRTFSSRFPHVRMFHYYDDNFLVGSKTPISDISVKRLAERLKIPEVKADLDRVAIRNLSDFLAHETWIPTQYFANGPYHNLDFPKLAYRAGKDFFYERMAKAFDFTKVTDVIWSQNYAKTSLISSALNQNFVNRKDTRSLMDSFCSSFASYSSGKDLQNPGCEQLKTLQQYSSLIQKNLERSPASVVSQKESEELARVIRHISGPFWSVDIKKVESLEKVCAGQTKNDLICKSSWLKTWAIVGNMPRANSLEKELAPRSEEIPNEEVAILNSLLAAAKFLYP